MFGSRIRLSTLAMFCRALSTMLESGVMIQKAVATSGRKLGDPHCRKIIADVATSLRKGDDLTKALGRHGGYFPPLFIDMVSVAEQTGTLAEVLRSLGDHYDNLLRLRRSFVGAITLPLLQLVAAVFIIAGVIFILGMIAESQGGKPLDILGWGLTGTTGALLFLGYVFGGFAGLVIAYLLLSRGLGQRQLLHGVLLQIPVIGSCMRSFAIARFSWGFALTQQAGMDIIPSLEAALRATSNGAFLGKLEPIVQMVMNGSDLTSAFADTGLFPEDYLEMVHVGETSGTVPEMLARLSPQFEDQARRSLAALAGAVGWLVWALVAGFIIFVVISIMLWYKGMLDEALKGF